MKRGDVVIVDWPLARPIGTRFPSRDQQWLFKTIETTAG